MNIPTPDEFAASNGYKPFPGKWDRWLSAVRKAVLSAQPIAGRHTTIDEHPGKGTVINVGDTRRGGAGGGGEPGTVPCPINVHVSVCLEWYPVGLPPEVDCVINISFASCDISPSAIECPIDITTSGFKINSFVGDITASKSGVDCGVIDVTEAQAGSPGALYWDAGAGEWTLNGLIDLPNYPASFSYGPVMVPVADLTTVGSITIVDDGCPSGGDPNPAATITFQFS